MEGLETANKLLKALLTNYKAPTSQEIQKFCQPLFDAFKINYFDYTRYYPNNTCHVFISDFNYATFFTGYSVYRNKKGYDVPTKILNPGKHLWQSYMCPHFLTEASSGFDHALGLTVVKSSPEFNELYNFGASIRDGEVLDLFLNHDYILETFFACFKEHFSSVLKQKDNRIILPHNPEPQPTAGKADPSLLKKLETMLRTITKIRKNNMLITMNEKLVSLSQQEINCLLLLAQGKTTKEIARAITISPKTADIHCNNLLRKTECNSRVEMLNKFSKNFINDLILTSPELTT